MVYSNVLYEDVGSGMDIDSITADLVNRDFYITVHKADANRKSLLKLPMDVPLGYHVGQQVTWMAGSLYDY